MRKQTKFVAVLSTAALLAVGAFMTSFAATGWAEEDSTWVYYDKDGGRVTDKWAKSGDNWYYLHGSGEMAIDTLIEDGDNYYYLDVNGVMVTNQWVAIENENAGTDNEPDEWWYYFQANGKALKGPENNKVSLKTVNGKKYAFTSEGKMLYGWVNADDATIITDDDDAWMRGDYYFGDHNDGSMTFGWRLIDITDDNATTDNDGNNWIQTAYNDDEDQSRWFWFKRNGKKLTASEGDLELKQKTINGRKYAFDQYGRMVAEWAVDFDQASSNYGRTLKKLATGSGVTSNQGNKEWSRAWMYFNSVEDGARVTRGWFKVVPAEGLNASKYNDDEDGWYYADNSGHLYASELKTIKGKKYGFDENGKMLDGMKFLAVSGSHILTENGYQVASDDDDNYPFDTESEFNKSSLYWSDAGYKCYYFGDENDGALKTGKIQVEIDGDKYNFNFGKAGRLKGAGKTGKEDKKYYSSGKLMAAGKDEKYQVIFPVGNSANAVYAAGSYVIGYWNYDDANQFALDLIDEAQTNSNLEVLTRREEILNELSDADLAKCGLTRNKLEDDKYADLAVFRYKNSTTGNYKLGLPSDSFMLVNTSGTVSAGNAKCKDGNNVYYKLYGGKIVSTFSED